MALDPVTKALKCDICGSSENVDVRSSGVGPISLAYCYECAMAGREQWAVLVGSFYGLTRENAHEAAHEIIKATCEFYGKTADDFWREIDELDRQMEEYEKQEAIAFAQSVPFKVAVFAAETADYTCRLRPHLKVRPVSFEDDEVPIIAYADEKMVSTQHGGFGPHAEAVATMLEKLAAEIRGLDKAAQDRFYHDLMEKKPPLTPATNPDCDDEEFDCTLEPPGDTPTQDVTE